MLAVLTVACKVFDFVTLKLSVSAVACSDCVVLCAKIYYVLAVYFNVLLTVVLVIASLMIRIDNK